MRRAAFILVFCFITVIAHTQITYADMYSGWFLQAKDSVARQDRLVIDITHEQWLDHPKGIDPKWYSWGFSFSKMFDFPVSRSFSFGLGAGIRSQHHYHNGEFRQYINGNSVVRDTLQPYANPVYKLNKNALNYVDAAVELRIKTGRQHLFKVYLGFKGGYLFNNHIKYKDDNSKYKKYNINGFSKFTYGPTLRIGFNNFCLFGNYNLTPLYENNTGQIITSVSLGITLFYL